MAKIHYQQKVMETLTVKRISELEGESPPALLSPQSSAGAPSPQEGRQAGRQPLSDQLSLCRYALAAWPGDPPALAGWPHWCLVSDLLLDLEGLCAAAPSHKASLCASRRGAQELACCWGCLWPLRRGGKAGRGSAPCGSFRREVAPTWTWQPLGPGWEADLVRGGPLSCLGFLFQPRLAVSSSSSSPLRCCFSGQREGQSRCQVLQCSKSSHFKPGEGGGGTEPSFRRPRELLSLWSLAGEKVLQKPLP